MSTIDNVNQNRYIFIQRSDTFLRINQVAKNSSYFRKNVHCKENEKEFKFQIFKCFKVFPIIPPVQKS